MASKSDARATASGFSKEERAAMKERAAELKKEAGRGRGKKAAADEAEMLDKIAKMPEPDRSVAERIHAIVTETAPDLSPKLWYGQPAYARDGKVVCFFRSGQADQERYSTFSFTQEVTGLDDEIGLWPTAYAVSALSEKAAKEIAKLVARALG